METDPVICVAEKEHIDNNVIFPDVLSADEKVDNRALDPTMYLVDAAPKQNGVESVSNNAEPQQNVDGSKSSQGVSQITVETAEAGVAQKSEVDGAQESKPPASSEMNDTNESNGNIDNTQENAPSGAANSNPLTMSLAERVNPGSSKRADFPIVPSKMALLVIDIQQYLSQPSSLQEEEKDSYFYNEALPRAVSKIQQLLESVRRKRDDPERKSSGCEVVFTYLEALTKDCRDVSLDYKLSGPQLSNLPTAPMAPAKFIEQIQPSNVGKGDIMIPKTSCSVFMSTNLHYVLQNLHIEQLVVCGQLTDQCVESAVRDAADLGYFVSVVEDACAAKTKVSHDKGLAGMQGFSRIVTARQILEELESAKDESESLKALAAAAVPVAPPAAAERAAQENDAQTSSAMGERHSIANIGIKEPSEWKPPNNFGAVTSTLLRTLQYADVKFLRYLSVDACNSIRCKAVPLDRLLQQGNGANLEDKVAIAEVCFAGLPTFGDFMTEGTKLDARRSLFVRPDLSSLRILPYASKTAVVLGTAHDQCTGELSPLCTRGLLSRVLQTAEMDHGIAFNVGAEIEFCLHRDSAPFEPVDDSVFGNSTTLDEQEDFISDLYDQLRQQDIELELLHAESGPGQLEIVLPYQRDPLKLADNVVLARETIRAVARAHKLKALFLPKIHEMRAGNGVHVHLSFRHLKSTNRLDRTANAFPHSNLDGEISAKGKSFLEGILAHLPALLSLTLPTTNSYKRVGPGCWTGHCVSWATDDKEVPLRVCADTDGNMSNVEFKLMDSTSNIYLALSGILAAGLDGIARNARLRPMYIPESKMPLDPLPSSLEESLECLRQDAFLLDSIGEKLCTGYIALRESEAEKSSKLTLEEEVQLAYQKT